MSRRAATRGVLAALIALIPAVVSAQGIAAWNFEAPNPKERGFAGNTALGAATGTTRVAWTVINRRLPVVQCVDVERAGSALAGRRLVLRSISPPIGGEDSC